MFSSIMQGSVLQGYQGIELKSQSGEMEVSPSYLLSLSYQWRAAVVGWLGFAA